uniref:Uncharacterized protein n=1 Tax=Zea mays TaxID=4577 RepID=B4FI14_MAIZE|nr:unknown [Zea mays]
MKIYFKAMEVLLIHYIR